MYSTLEQFTYANVFAEDQTLRKSVTNALGFFMVDPWLLCPLIACPNVRGNWTTLAVVELE